MQSPAARDMLMRLANRRFSASEDGQDLLEYGLLAALIAVFAIGAVTTLGQTVYNLFWKTIAASF
jgi:Flp pilus assembly pilin Flp